MTGFVPRYLDLESARLPVIVSIVDLIITPLERPTYKYNWLANYCSITYWLIISTIATDSIDEGNLWLATSIKGYDLSGETSKILQVWSDNPTPKKLHLCLPAGIGPISKQVASENWSIDFWNFNYKSPLLLIS